MCISRLKGSIEWLAQWIKESILRTINMKFPNTGHKEIVLNHFGREKKCHWGIRLMQGAL